MFVCVCVYCAGGLYIIHDLGGRLLHVVCVCTCVLMTRRAGQSGARYVACDSRPSDGGRQLLHVDLSSLAVHASMTGEPKVLQPASYLEYGKRLLRGRPQQPPPKAPKGKGTFKRIVSCKALGRANPNCSAYKLPRVWYAVAEGDTATTATDGTK